MGGGSVEKKVWEKHAPAEGIQKQKKKHSGVHLGKKVKGRRSRQFNAEDKRKKK